MAQGLSRRRAAGNAKNRRTRQEHSLQGRSASRRVWHSIRRLQSDVRTIAATVDPLVDHVAAAEEELHDLDARVAKLERAKR